MELNFNLGSSRPAPPVTPQDQVDLVSALAAFGAVVRVVDRAEGPRTTTYQVIPAPGVTLTRIKSRMRDVAVQLGAPSCNARDESGKLFVEVGRENALIPLLSELPLHADPREILIGVDSRRVPVYVRMERLIHGLVCGTSGAGKGFALQTLIAGFRRTPDCTVVVLDPKSSNDFGGTDWGSGLIVANTTQDMRTWAELVYGLMFLRGPRNDKHANWAAVASCFSPGPVLLVVDELQAISDAATLNSIFQVLAMGRSAGIHCLLATQHPSAELIGNSMRVNCATRLVLQVASASDSRVALGEGGAEHLLGRGDAILKYDSKTRRIQIPSLEGT